MLKICIALGLMFCILLEIQGSSLRVIGGYEPPPYYGRFHASLQNLTGYHICGGAVVSDQHIVSAAHCMVGADPEYVKVVVGTIDLTEGGNKYDVAKITIHPEYDQKERTNDIAILQINGTFSPNNVDILKLYNKPLNEGDDLVLSGFGSLEPQGLSSDRMYALNLTVFSQETCKYAMRYTREVYDVMFCTFTRIGEGTCHGDSGGPLLKDNQLAGVVSWGIPCGRGFPDVHTRISPYVFWIHEEMGKTNKCFGSR